MDENKKWVLTLVAGIVLILLSIWAWTFSSTTAICELIAGGLFLLEALRRRRSPAYTRRN